MKSWREAVMVMVVVLVAAAAEPCAAAAHRSVHRRQAAAPSPAMDSFLAGLGDGDNTVLGSLLQLGTEDLDLWDPLLQPGTPRRPALHQPQPPGPPQPPPQHNHTQQQQQQGASGMSAGQATAAVGALMRQLHNMTFLPLVPREGDPPHAHGDDPLLLQYLDAVRGDAWAQFKSLAVGYSSWLEHEYSLQHLTAALPLDLVKKVLDLGDRVNFLRVVGRRVDPGLAAFLADKMQPLFDHFSQLAAGRMVGGSLANAVGGVVRDAAWKTLRQFVDHVLSVAGGVVTREEIEHFREDLAKTSPLAARGLQMLLDGPPPEEGVGEEEEEEAEGRSISRNGYRDYHDGGYGGHGAYDDSYGTYGGVSQGYSSGGYAAGVHMDPYLILAGLGAAVLLAYLAYRVLVTTEAGGDGRSLLDDLALRDLSDTPVVLHSLHSLLDDAERKYDTKRSAPRDDMDDFTDALNDLWYQHQAADGCVRCALFDAMLDYAHVGSASTSVPALAVSWLAHLLGAERSGQLVDQVVGQVVEGQPVTCRRHQHTCDLK
ncbi:uncharacterized protein LOC123510097 [Portunus trituberculatus]|uniref:uncharacterized protein LOC123510097 n=1 Tax=Portunus trituberculatus TaxID=210409 RepID=UPI001E1CEC85|nr:uncharacterized protein LOC123510097 [Portunus trituberculatus]